jgi:hypothetical protein
MASYHQDHGSLDTSVVEEMGEIREEAIVGVITELMETRSWSGTSIGLEDECYLNKI